MSGQLCRHSCDIVEQAFNYAWMQAGLSLDAPAQQQSQAGELLRVWNLPFLAHYPVQAIKSGAAYVRKVLQGIGPFTNSECKSGLGRKNGIAIML